MKQLKDCPVVELVGSKDATPERCSIQEYVGEKKKSVGWIIIRKGTKKCILSIRRIYLLDTTDILAEARPLAEHIAREWAKLPD